MRKQSPIFPSAPLLASHTSQVSPPPGGPVARNLEGNLVTLYRRMEEVEGTAHPVVTSTLKRADALVERLVAQLPALPHPQVQKRSLSARIVDAVTRLKAGAPALYRMLLILLVDSAPSSLDRREHYQPA